MKICCFGDSNTYGFDPRSYFGGRYDISERWTGTLQSLGWDIVPKGMNGRTIPKPREYENAIREIMSVGVPDILLIMLGTNDLLCSKSLTAEGAAERLETFAEYVTANSHLGNNNILIISPPRMDEGEWTVENQNALEESLRMGDAYKAMAQKHGFRFVDATKLQLSLCSDGVHLMPKGHRLLAEELNKYLLQAL